MTDTIDTPMILEVNCATGVSTSRPLTEEEISSHETAAASFADMQAAQAAADEAKAAAKASAAEKLAALGLTAEEIAAIQG
jgi:hypothetical protein